MGRFGDLSPITTLGRIVTLGALGLMLVIVPVLSNKLVALLMAKSAYTRASYRCIPSTAHVVVCGALGSAKTGATTALAPFSCFLHVTS